MALAATSLNTLHHIPLDAPPHSPTTMEATPSALFIAIFPREEWRETSETPHPPIKILRCTWLTHMTTEVPLPEDGTLLSAAARGNRTFFHCKPRSPETLRTLRTLEDNTCKTMLLPERSSSPIISPDGDFMVVPLLDKVFVYTTCDGTAIAELEGMLLSCHWTSAKRFCITFPDDLVHCHIQDDGSVVADTFKTKRLVQRLQFDCVGERLCSLQELPLDPSIQDQCCLLPIDPSLKHACVFYDNGTSTECMLFNLNDGNSMSSWPVGELPLVAVYHHRVALHRIENGAWVLFFHDRTNHVAHLFTLKSGSIINRVEHAVNADAEYKSASIGNNTIVVYTNSEAAAEVEVWTCRFDNESGTK